MRIENLQKNRTKLYVNLFLLTLVISIIYITTKSYVSQEKFIYSWDYIGYQKSTDILIGEFKKSFLKGVLEFINALFADYSKLFCLPILPFYLVFGTSRFSFIFSLAIVYISSFSLMMGVIFSNLTLKKRWLAFWLATFITLMTPAVWISVLRGYPDIGGVTLFMAGILVYWKDTSLKQKGQPLKIAGIMSVLVVFRRHFAYAFRSFIITIILQSLIAIGRKKIHRINEYKLDLEIIKRAILVLILFLIFSIHLSIKIFYFNYRELYSSYEESILKNIEYYAGSFGLIFILLAAIGFIVGLRQKGFDSKKLGFLGLLGIVTIFQWVFSSKQLGVHYASHFLPFMILGISTLIWSTDSTFKYVGNKFRYYFVAIVILFEVFLLALNFNIGLGHVSLVIQPFQQLLARREAPLIRSDYSEVVRLIEYLKENSGPDDSTYIAASSYGILNKSIIEEGEKELYKEQKLNIIRTSDIDSRDFYPLNGLLNARYIVVTDPMQYHINPEQQKVITIVGDMFRNKQSIAQDFEQVSEQFSFQEGVTAYLYKRVKPTSLETIFSTLQWMEQKIDRKPGRETDWLTLESGQLTVIERDALFKTAHVSPLSVKSRSPASLLYFGKLFPKTRINGQINIMSNCSQSDPILLRSKTLDINRNTIEEKYLTYIPTTKVPFALELNGENARFLELNLEFKNSTKTQRYCTISLNHLVVSN
ncbi:hypothetical protein [Altericista sp. CCNU0014]|uniref:hypothetical protein n=1 Tax=Altericista sp. CCNU0014 TaxID=3082949 RepID=UPI00384E175B